MHRTGSSSKKSSLHLKSAKIRKKHCLTFLSLLITTFLWHNAAFAAHATNEDTANIEHMGDITVVLLPSLAYGATFYLDDDEGRGELYKSFFSNLALTEVVKRSVQRERPNKHDKKSFPSGHTSVSFQAATFIYQRYGFKPAIPAYLAASFVGYSRIKSDWHYGSDVLAGAIIGTASSLYFTNEYKGFQVKPVATHDSLGFTISKTW